MTDSLLTIVQNVCAEIGLAQPMTVIGNQDANAQQILLMLNQEGRDLAKSNDWTVLVRLYTFSSTNGTSEYALPADYDRLVRDTEWDQTNHRPLLGPLSAQEYETIKQGLIGSVLPYNRYRILRSALAATRKIIMSPTPTSSGLNFAFEYVSNGWCTDVGGTALQTSFAADTDLPLLNSDLLQKGTVCRFKRSLGLEFGSEADELATMLAREISRDKPSSSIDLSRRTAYRLISNLNMPVGTIGH